MKGAEDLELKDKKNENKENGFFQDGILKEKEDIIKKSQEKDKRPSLNLPPEREPKTKNPENNDDDLLPFFAKDYPTSSEEKEEIIFINSPLPSESSNVGGEAEEVEGIEKKDNQNSTEKNKPKSIDFNTELEAEQERPSTMITREQVLVLYNKQQEKNREEERRKKEEDEKLELDKKKEEERRKKEEKEKLELDKKKEEERMKKEEKEKLELVKKKKEERRKKSQEKNDPSLLSKKKSEDNSNEVKQYFPGGIPEENAVNKEEEKYSKKKLKKNSNVESPKKKFLPQNDKKNKKVSDFNEKEKKGKKNKKNKKKSSISKKSNGLGLGVKQKISKKWNFDDNDENEEFSDYGDELQSSDSDVPKKKK